MEDKHIGSFTELEMDCEMGNLHKYGCNICGAIHYSVYGEPFWCSYCQESPFITFHRQDNPRFEEWLNKKERR